MLTFAGFIFDPGRQELSKDGAALPRSPKTLALLRYLLANAGRVLGKDELIQALWGAVVVTDDSLVQCVKDLRVALADRDQRLIKTLPRRGYMFDVAVNEFKREPAVAAPRAQAPRRIARARMWWALGCLALALLLGDNTRLTIHAQMRDAFAARKYLISTGYPADRIAIMGTGRGGTIALLAADRTFMQSQKDRFALALAISAGCVFHPRDPKPGAQIFMAVAEKDDMGVLPCQKLANEYAAVGGKVTVKFYPRASNGFDGHPGAVWMTRDSVIETFAACIVRVEADGRFSYNDKTFAESDSSALFVEMRKACIRRGGNGWTNLTQKANVTLDVIDFLDANFRR
ncbi:MAG TPA: winged helix-turn-helix domain-containing protein [Variovorax sp.]|nr:winged helix-turn-helix domain-containing protein [Variovorax sp.]